MTNPDFPLGIVCLPQKILRSKNDFLKTVDVISTYDLVLRALPSLWFPETCTLTRRRKC